MTTLIELQKNVTELPPEQYGKFRQWLEDYEVEQELHASSVSLFQLLDEEEGDSGNQLIEE